MIGDRRKSSLARVALGFMAGVIVSVAPAYAQKNNEGGEQDKQEVNYTKVLFLNQCSRNYYNYFNPGDKLDPKGKEQMVNHIKASCQCMYKNLNKMFSESDIMHYIQSRHVSSEVALNQYGNTPNQIYRVMARKEFRDECNHLNDMGASYDEG